MKNRFIRLLSFTTLLSLLLTFATTPNASRAVEPQKATEPISEVTSSVDSVTSLTPAPKRAEVLGALPKSGLVKVFIHLKDAPLTIYDGSLSNLKSANKGGTLSVESPEAQAYLSYLAGKHVEVLDAIHAVSPQASQLTDYKIALNALGMEVPVSDIEKLRDVAGVTAIEVNQIYKIDTDSSNQFIGTPSFWQNLGGGSTGTNGGENVVVGVIDTGIYNPSSVLTTTGIHPSLVDPSPVGGDYASTFTYKGVCAPTSPQSQDGKFGPCNDKLIGAWWYNASNIAFPGESHSPLDEGGHGTHTATTTAGNGGTTSPFGTLSGVAPRARVIAYKVCWEEDPATSDDGGCGGLDSVSAIEQGITDQVKVFNYSISGGNNPWTDAVEVAFRNATAAGIIVNASAGNAGTDGSVAHNSPWLITVAASTQSREFRGYVRNVTNGTTPFTGTLVGASLFPAVVTGTVKLAPPQAAFGETVAPSLCRAPYAAGTFNPSDIVICRRGVNARVEKYANVFAGGANASILVNASPNQGLSADYCAPGKVCIHLEYNATLDSSRGGEELINYVKNSPVNSVTAGAFGGVKFYGPGDKMAGFSSRGPAVNNPNILKPDVTLVGVDVAAGHTAFVWDNGFADDQKFQVISGTSMSSPHSAGVSALMRQKFPTWTPAEIKSAMMMTAKTTVTKPDGVTEANPFNMGSGRVDLTKVFQAGLVMNETVANFISANPSSGGDPRTLNLPNVVNNACVQVCTWTRVVKNPTAQSMTWNASAVAINGTPAANLVTTVSPSSFTLAPGASQTLTIQSNVSGAPVSTNWLFGRITLTEAGGLAPNAVLPVAVIVAQGQVPPLADITTRRYSGQQTVSGYQAIEITQATVREYGLVKGVQTTQALAEDSSNGSAFDNLSDGVFYTTLDVPAGTKRLVAQITKSTSLDIDLFVARDANNDGIPQAGEVVYTSATAAVLEKVDVLDPTAGKYFAVVQNWAASPSAPDLTTLVTAVVPSADLGNMDVVAPTSVPAGTPFSVVVKWNIPTIQTGDIWFGAFDLGSDAAHPGNIGTTRVNITKLDNEVSKVASSPMVNVGDYVTYTVTITNYGSVADTFYLTDTLPAGLQIDPISLTGGATYDAANNRILWNGTIAAPTLNYQFTDSRTGGPSLPFVDLTTTSNVYNLCANSTACDEAAVNYTFTTLGTFKFFGTPIDKLRLFSNGFAMNGNLPLNSTGNHYTAQNMPDATYPNGVLAGLWNDLDMDGTSATDPGGGTMLLNALMGVDAQNPNDKFIVAHFKNAQQYGNASSNLNFNLFYRLGDSGQFCTVYGATLTGDLVNGGDSSGVSVGVENDTGTVGATYYFNGSPAANKPAPNTTICATPAPSGVVTKTFTFRAKVLTAGAITNTVEYSSTAVSGMGSASSTIQAVQDQWMIYLPLVFKN